MKKFNKLRALKDYYNAYWYYTGITFSEFLYIYNLWKKNANFESFEDYAEFIVRENGSLHRDDIKIY